jgi:hypothetical protein
LLSPLSGAMAGIIGGMAFSFLYLVVRALFGALVRSRRGLHVKDVELLVRLRVPETRFGPLERVLAGSSGDDFMLLLAV